MTSTPAPVRVVAAAAVVTSTVGLLAGCSKALDGALGVGPGESGAAVVQVVTCTYPATEVQLLVDDGLEQVTEAPLQQQAGTSSDYPLEELFGADAVAALDPDVAYRVRAVVADSDGTRYTHGATFTLAEVADYPDGEVSDDAADTLPREAFALQACADEDANDKS